MNREDGARRVLGPLPVLGDALDFLRLIWSVDRALQLSSNHTEANVGVTGPQHLVIRIVGRFPGIPAGHLAKILHIHPGTLTGIVKRLERQGLIRRRTDPKDRRRALLGLTEDGRVLARESIGSVETAIRRTLGESTPDQLRATRTVLESLARALLDACGASKSESDHNHEARSKPVATFR